LDANGAVSFQPELGWIATPGRAAALIDSVVPILVPLRMASVQGILDEMRREPANVRFADLQKICESFFGEPRTSGGSHVIFKTPWIGDPRINIQNDRGKAKPYQVRQVLLAIDKLTMERK
jgi:hypothetical protein